MAAFCAAAATLAAAQPEPAVTMPAEKVSPLIVPVEVPATNAAVAARHRCGGIGSDESTAMRARMKDHPLSLLFAQQGGASVADVDVRIEGAAGVPPLAFRATGPVCLVDLPAGRYAVQATRDGVTKKESVTLGGGAKTVDFRF